MAAKRPACSGGGSRRSMLSTGASEARARSAAASRLATMLPASTVASSTPGPAPAPTAPATMTAKRARKGRTSKEGTASATPPRTLVVLATTACVTTKPTSPCWMPIASGSPTGAKMIEAHAAAKVNCITPVYVPATTEPILVGAGSAVACTGAARARLSLALLLSQGVHARGAATLGDNIAESCRACAEEERKRRGRRRIARRPMIWRCAG
mmetsp:Transcript_32126/g.107209  ORF Transcript_32126/g.107209 Transcript_32126/m.107209 type:complete len:212 (-) Transcript_32126:77-712(-)